MSDPYSSWRDEFAGRRALITGGTSGIGRAISAALLQTGCRVTATGLSEEECERARNDDELRGADIQSLNVQSQTAVDRITGALGRLDILVNCAGMIRRDAEFEMPTFLQVLDVNLSGTMRLCVATKPLLARQGGSIVNIASLLSFFGGPRVPAYSASKGGVAQLTKSLAVAWASEGIRVNALAPGWIATDLTRGLQEDPERSAQLVGRTPLGRWGQPEDVAGAVVFLCSRAAAFITGAILPVDGGYSAM